MKSYATWAAAIAFGAMSVPALAQGTAEALLSAPALNGVASVLHGQKMCGFEVSPDALNRYLDERGLLTPDALAKIDAELDWARRARRELTQTECGIRQAVAKKMGVLN